MNFKDNDTSVIENFINKIFWFLFYFFLYKTIFYDYGSQEFRLIFQEPGLESVKNFTFSFQGISYFATFGTGVILGLISYNKNKKKN